MKEWAVGVMIEATSTSGEDNVACTELSGCFKCLEYVQLSLTLFVRGDNIPTKYQIATENAMQVLKVFKDIEKRTERYRC
ncbi:unnamed protein product [Anisakis simplex]|uniref:Ovule protein n=1 Tax=Anisakis simplex TaxID=6269 RepID=A0A0M3K354_ANISI|nr:unnamed protein product [Anisakis simplex]